MVDETGGVPGNAALRRRLADLRAGFRNRLAEMLVTIESEMAGILAAEAWDDVLPARLDALAGIVHRVVGSAGTFGYAQVSTAAAPLELMLRAMVAEQALPASERRLQLNRCLAALREAWVESERLSEGLAPPPRRLEEANHRLFVIDAEGSLSATIRRHVAFYGYDVASWSDVAAAEAAMATAGPAAIVLDFGLARADEAIVEFAARHGSALPILAVSAEGDFETRLRAAQAGCSAFLASPLNPDELADWLDRLAGSPASAPYRILIVDDDRYLAESYSLALSLAGMHPTVLNDPTGIMEVLDDMSPDLILMDFYMPGCNGMDLARVIRQQQKHLSIPIVFLSVETDNERQLSARSYGGDDFLSKPIEMDRLVASVRMRAKRARALRTVMESDSLTGLLNHVRTKERLDAELTRANRHGAKLSVALLDLDRFKSVNDTQGHLAGDRVLKSLARMLTHRLRRSDVVGRYGGEEFMVILPETGLDNAAHVIDSLRRTFAEVAHHGQNGEFRCTFSAGVATRGDAPDVDSLIVTVDAALYRAKERGRNRVES